MGEGLMIRQRLGRALLLWLMTFQLAFLPSKQQNSPGYLGCFLDVNGDRALSVGPAEEYMSVEWCFRHCLEPTAYKYAGLQYAHECWCGDNEDYDRHGEQSDCRDKCTGNSDQICGDSWRISVYRVSQGVCSNDIGPPTNGHHDITNPRSLSYNLNNFKFFGTRVDFSCDPGYNLHGASKIECIETGYNNVTWSDSVPTCEVPSIQTTLQSKVTDSLMTIGNSKTDEMPSSTDFISETPANNNPNTGVLQKGAIVGIAVGAGILTVLILLVILLCKKRRKPKKKRPDVTVATIGDRYTNNAYALPEIVNQSITDQSTMPVYSRVIKDRTDSDDVYATPDDITSPGGDGNAPSDQAKGVTASRDQENGWVENTLYACESFPAEPAPARVKYSDGQTNSGPPLKMEGKPGWVENNIYE
ncbi:protein SLG1-like [Patiria miniata]|uniref:WSC domain-containing protein n=1 Tax=Patiria miniata TaxID=46514 RepID=A0A913ZWQ6_PATMI|nr:protein SLG1-like [Patiria miniata]